MNIYYHQKQKPYFSGNTTRVALPTTATRAAAATPTVMNLNTFMTPTLALGLDGLPPTMARVALSSLATRAVVAVQSNF